jgi:hypothetical protein
VADSDPRARSRRHRLVGLDGETLLVDRRDGGVVLLNPSAAAIAEALLAGDDAEYALIARFGVDPATARRDVRAMQEALDAPGRPVRSANPLTVQPRDGAWTLAWKGVPFATIDGDITVYGEMPPEDARRLAAPHALMKKGVHVLHASAVQAGERAHLFVGPSGAGKTTIARRLGGMAEDLVVVAGDAMVEGAEGAIRDWARSSDRFDAGALTTGPRLPIAALHFLGPRAGDAVVDTPLARIEVLGRLLANSFGELGPPVWDVVVDGSVALARWVTGFETTLPDGLAATEAALLAYNPNSTS